jgi:hypothetical protein
MKKKIQGAFCFVSRELKDWESSVTMSNKKLHMILNLELNCGGGVDGYWMAEGRVDGGDWERMEGGGG